MDWSVVALFAANVVVVAGCWCLERLLNVARMPHDKVVLLLVFYFRSKCCLRAPGNFMCLLCSYTC